MKWWERLKQIQKHRWLPFFLPVIGTLLYIAIAVLLVPSEFGDKADNDGAESEKASADVTRTKPAGRATRSKRLAVPSTSSVPAAPSNP